MRVEMYSQKDRCLFIHLNEEDLAAWLFEPMGWVESGFPSIASLRSPAELDPVETVVLFDAGSGDDIAIVKLDGDAVYVDVGPVDPFIDRLHMNEEGATIRTMDRVRLITGPVEMIVMTDLTGWERVRYDHWIFGRGNPRRRPPTVKKGAARPPR